MYKTNILPLCILASSFVQQQTSSEKHQIRHILSFVGQKVSVADTHLCLFTVT